MSLNRELIDTNFLSWQELCDYLSSKSWVSILPADIDSFPLGDEVECHFCGAPFCLDYPEQAPVCECCRINGSF